MKENILSDLFAHWSDATARLQLLLNESDSRNTTGGDWARTLQQWWQSSADELPDTSREAFELLVEQANQIYRLSELFSSDADADPNPLSPILANFERWYAGLFSIFGRPGNDFFVAKSKATGRDSLDQWVERLINLASPVGHIGAYADTRRLAKSAVAFQQAFINYATLVVEAAERANFLMEWPENKKKSSARALHTAWIEASEQAYLELVSRDEYPKAYGELVNAASSFELERQALTANLLDTHSIPSMRVIENLESKLHDALRRIRTLETALQQTKVAPAIPDSLLTASNEEKPSSTKKQASKKKTAKKKAAKKTTAKVTATRKKAVSKKASAKTAGKKKTASKKASTKATRKKTT